MQQIIGHLKEQFSKGHPVLFTGAGFSCNAENIANESVPPGGRVKQMLWDLCYPGKAFDDRNTLQDLFSVARERHRGDLMKLLQRTFTIKSSTIPEWYGDIFSLPWYRVYSLNIDDLAFAVQRRFSLPRALHSVSATTGKLRVLSAVNHGRLDYV